MRAELLFQTSRSAVVQILDYGKYHAEGTVTVDVSDGRSLSFDRTVFTVDSFLPGTEYTLKISNGSDTVELSLTTDPESFTLNVRQFGAYGDGETDDTLAIQAAILSCPKDGRVVIPKGVYRTSSLFLKSDLVLELEEGAEISAFTDPDKFPVLPGLIPSEDSKTELNLGTWEGDPVDMHGSILTGIGVENVAITGKGTLNGNASFENWWGADGTALCERARRPRMIFLNRCKDVTVTGIKVMNSPAWNIHPYFSDDIRFLDMEIRNPKISPNTDGIDPESVHGLEIAGVYFSLGDDCIAVKSGRFYMGHKYKRASEHLNIHHCCMKHGHGSVTLGSEMAAGVKHLHVHDCEFIDTDRGLRVKTRRGRGNDCVTEDILFENISMKGVLTPFVVNSYYWCCDPDGKSEYVRTKEKLPVDERTPFVGELHFKDIEAVDCHVAAAFLYGLPEAKIGKVTFENVKISFAENPTPEYPAMMADVEPCTNMGIFINNAENVVLDRVTVEGAKGESLLLENIDHVVNVGS